MHFSDESTFCEKNDIQTTFLVDISKTFERSVDMSNFFNLSYFFGGLDQKLVGVESVEPIKKILA